MRTQVLPLVILKVLFKKKIKIINLGAAKPDASKFTLKNSGTMGKALSPSMFFRIFYFIFS